MTWTCSALYCGSTFMCRFRHHSWQKNAIIYYILVNRCILSIKFCNRELWSLLCQSERKFQFCMTCGTRLYRSFLLLFFILQILFTSLFKFPFNIRVTWCIHLFREHLYPLLYLPVGHWFQHLQSSKGKQEMKEYSNFWYDVTNCYPLNSIHHPISSLPHHLMIQS